MAAKIVAVASGKGGVGKSLVALNLAVALGRCGRRILLVDADLGLGNIAILLGLSPEYTLEDVLTGRCAVADALLDGPEGVAILPAATDMDTEFWERAQFDAERGEQLSECERAYDCIIVDTGAGIAPRSMDFVAAADEVLLLITPEPTAIADAYATLKVLLSRRLEIAVGLLVNMIDSTSEAADLQEKFQQLASRFLGAAIDNRGYIPLDRYVREAVKRQVPFVLAVPPTPAAEAVAEIAGVLLPQRRAADWGEEGLFRRVLQYRSRYHTGLIASKRI